VDDKIAYSWGGRGGGRDFMVRMQKKTQDKTQKVLGNENNREKKISSGFHAP
jgi:hypothetical protein